MSEHTTVIGSLIPLGVTSHILRPLLLMLLLSTLVEKLLEHLELRGCERSHAAAEQRRKEPAHRGRCERWIRREVAFD